MLLLLLLLMLFCGALTPAFGAGVYDPCAGQASVKKNDGFTIGLAFYPGGAAEDWVRTDGAPPPPFFFFFFFSDA